VSDATVLVDMGGGGDGCSKAYSKFKANIAKMEALKKKAESKVAKAEKGKRKADVGLKRCTDDHKEIVEKSTFKKAVNDKKIKQAVKAKNGAYKKKTDAALKKKTKALKGKAKAAKKALKKATKSTAACKAKFKAKTKEQKDECKKDLASLKKNTKAQSVITIKVKVAEAVEQKEQALTKKLTDKHTKKLKAAKKESAEEIKKCQKKRKIEMDTLKTEMRVAVEKATDLVPKAVQKAFEDTKIKLAKRSEERDKAVSDKSKAGAKAKEQVDDLVTKKTKVEMKSKDCHVREANLRKSLAAAEEKAKLLAVKLDEKTSALGRANNDLQTNKRNLDAVTENLKAKEEILKVSEQKLSDARKATMKAHNKVKMIMAKLSAGEGALMAEIESLKKSRDSEMERVTIVGNNLQKCHAEAAKTRRDLNGKIVKLRETGQRLFTAKRDIDKYKSKYETTQMAHTTVTEQYRNCNSKMELSMDRMKDAKVKSQGCEEAMRRMKTYNADQLNDKKMEVTRLRQQVITAKDEARKLAMGQRERSAAQALAKSATDKAVADALAKAQAKGLAVKNNAQDAVDKAAKEAVKIANQQAVASAGAAQ